MDPPVASGGVRVGALRLGHQPGLDGLRGIAAVLVLMTHGANLLWPDSVEWMAKGGVLGVHLFFVLSGFLITALLLQERDRSGSVDVVGFAERRTRRLVPALVAMLAVLMLRAALDPAVLLRNVLANAVFVLSFTANVVYSGNEVPLLSRIVGDNLTAFDGDYLSHIWSVAVEAHFYALWGLCVWIATRRLWSNGRIALLAGGLALGVVVWRALELAAQGKGQWMAMYVQTHARLDAPFIGAVAGAALCAGWLDGVPRRLASSAGAVGLAAVLVAAFTVDIPGLATTAGLPNLAIALGSVLAVAGVVLAPASGLGRLLAVRPLRFLGTISYSLYVWHMVVFQTVAHSDAGWLSAGSTRFVVGFATTVPVSWASYRFVEKPFLRRKARQPATTTTVTAQDTTAPIPS